jgi:hypothetical protein
MGGMLSMPKSSKRKKTTRKKTTRKKSAKLSASKDTKKVYKYPHGNHSHKKKKALADCK